MLIGKLLTRRGPFRAVRSISSVICPRFLKNQNLNLGFFCPAAFSLNFNFFTSKRFKFKRVGDRPLGEELRILDQSYRTDEWTNLPDKVIQLIGRDLYRNPGNPIYLLSESIRQHFHDHQAYVFPNPVVDLWSNFDSILVPEDHISRSRTDTFYIDRGHVLRGHTSAHQSVCFDRCFKEGRDGKYLVIGDVYRRDEVNRTHHAAFHQCEIVQLYQKDDPEMITEGITDLFDPTQPRTESCQEGYNPKAVQIVEHELKRKIESYIHRLLGPDLETRWVDAYFPFTHPSWELEIRTEDGDWMEMLGCGIVSQVILNRTGQQTRIGWALGLGLERLAMLYYQIPDIRLFWTRDSGFLVQFSQAKPFDRITYKPVSAYPQKVFDISFWLPVDSERASEWSPNDVHAIIQDVGGELVEQAHLVDQYRRPKDGRVSNCYRIVYRSMERPLTNAEVNVVHEKIERQLVEQLKVDIR